MASQGILVLGRSEAPAGELLELFGRSGITASFWNVADGEGTPNAPVFVALEENGVDTSRSWSRKASAAARRRTVAWGRRLGAADIVELDRLKIGYVCKASAGIAQLLKIIGIIDAGAVSEGQARVASAQRSAESIFINTSAAFDLFNGGGTFDRDFYEGLKEDFATRIDNTPLFLLIDAIAANQDTTVQHCSLVTTIAVAFGGLLGLSSRETSRIFMAAFFHDIGKAAIPKAVIDKPGRLTADEFRLMRTHAEIGHEVLRRYPETAGEIADVALHHHEMLDGSGYPQGLKGPEIPDLVRIITICDIFAALIERRSYKPPMPPREAYDILKSMGGKLDQDLVHLFAPVVEAIADPKGLLAGELRR
jgi:uncharacterized domain HDIG